MTPQQYRLRWKYHHDNLQNMFSQLLDRGCFCDVTIACEGQTLRAHRVVLCACSTYFDSILSHSNMDSKDPIILMRDCRFEDVKSLIEFMYKGEIHVDHDNLPTLMRTATDLCIKGLADLSWSPDSVPKPYNSPSHTMQPQPQQQHQHTRQATANQQRTDNINHSTPNNSHNNHNHHPNDNSLLTPMHGTPSHIHQASAFPLSSSAYNGPTPASSRSSTHHQHQPQQQQPHHAPPHRLELRQEAVGVLPPKRKRGRPPLDAEFDCYSTPRITHVECGIAPAEEDPFADMPSTTEMVTPRFDDDGDSGGGASSGGMSGNHVALVEAMLDDGGSRDATASAATTMATATAASDDEGRNDRVEELREMANLVSGIGGSGSDGGSDVVGQEDNGQKEQQQQQPTSIDTDDGQSQESQSLLEEVKQKKEQKPHKAEHFDSVASGSNSSSRTWNEANRVPMGYEEDMKAGRLIPKLERPDTPNEYDDDDEAENERLQRQLQMHMQQQRQQMLQMEQMKQDAALARELEERRGARYLPLRGNSLLQPLPTSPMGGDSGHNSSMDCLTPQDLIEWGDVVKLNDYLRNGRRPHFWEESFTVRIMDAIKNKSLEMKKGAMLLGVSYGTLYGRYRETYGCLKHSFRSFWNRREINGNDLMQPHQGGQFPNNAIIDRFDRSETSISPQPQQQLQASSSSAVQQQQQQKQSVGGGDEVVVSYVPPKPIASASLHHLQPPPPMIPSHSVRPTSFPPPPALYASNATRDFSITALAKPFVPVTYAAPTTTTTNGTPTTPPLNGAAAPPDAHRPLPLLRTSSHYPQNLQQLHTLTNTDRSDAPK